MAKLVILNQGMTGRTFDLNVERTTVGRVEDNTFQITDPSVSSHHAEIILRGSDIVIKDLNSTNGSFVNNDKITETILKPGQTLRFGQVELRIDDGRPVSAPTPAGGTPPAPAPAKKQVDATMIIPRGVSLSDLEQGGARPPGFDTNTVFSKKKNKANTYFIIAGVVVAIVIIVLIVLAWSKVSAGHQ